MHVGPVIAVSDLERARAFYEGQLGLVGAPSPGGGYRLVAEEGTVLYLLPGFSDAGTASWPLASFLVANVTAKVRDLRSLGVRFLGQDELSFDVDEDGVSHTAGMQVAWMRDPDGSVLTLFHLD